MSDEFIPIVKNSSLITHHYRTTRSFLEFCDDLIAGLELSGSSNHMALMQGEAESALKNGIGMQGSTERFGLIQVLQLALEQVAGKQRKGLADAIQLIMCVL